MLGHIELPIKAMTRILKRLSKGMTSGTERTLRWKVMWIRMRPLFRIGISWQEKKNFIVEAEELGKFEHSLLHNL